jgi:hypothetical protein
MRAMFILARTKKPRQVILKGDPKKGDGQLAVFPNIAVARRINKRFPKAGYAVYKLVPI